MEFLIESLAADWEAFLRFSPRLIYGVALLILFLVAGRVIGGLLGRIFRRSDRLRANGNFLQQIITWGIASVGILLALGLMGFQGIAASLLATGGVVAIVLGFAFREIGENLLAGFFLTFSRPFSLGDQVKTGDITGVIKSIELRHVHVRTFDACDVYVPSAQIFRQPLYNYTRDGLRRPKFSIGVAYHDEPAAVIELLEQAARGVPDVLPEPAAFVTVSEFAAAVVVYEVYFWIDVTKSQRGFIGTSNDVKLSCWRALQEAGMTFSTDTTTALEIKSVPRIEIMQDSATDTPGVEKA